MEEFNEKQDGMTDSQLNSFLEQIAQLIEAKALTVAEAAEIVRQSKA